MIAYIITVILLIIALFKIDNHLFSAGCHVIKTKVQGTIVSFSERLIVFAVLLTPFIFEYPKIVYMLRGFSVYEWKKESDGKIVLTEKCFGFHKLFHCQFAILEKPKSEIRAYSLGDWLFEVNIEIDRKEQLLEEIARLGKPRDGWDDVPNSLETALCNAHTSFLSYLNSVAIVEATSEQDLSKIQKIADEWVKKGKIPFSVIVQKKKEKFKFSP